MRGLKEKRVLITGAAGGIGTATAARFVEERAQVVALDHDAEALHRLQATLAGLSGAIVADVTELRIGQHLRAGDLQVGENVKLETEKGVVIAHVITPKKVEAEEEAAEVAEEAVAEEAAEPEVIKKGKGEEAEEGGSKE